MKWWRTAARALSYPVLIGILGLPVATGAAATMPRQDTALQWTPCNEGLECARVSVPLNYSRPNGPTIELALARLPAANPQRRIGSLLVNPGGPGAPGTELAAASRSFLPQELRDVFDIVGFDPRGTGASRPAVHCDADHDALLGMDLSPDTDGERRALVKAWRSFGHRCAAGSKEQLAHVSTAETVRDMDRIRAALGEEKLTYLGLSYGTYLGALYADKYPKRVRALVLAGAVDPHLDLADVIVSQSRAFEKNLDEFLEQCSQDPSCPFNSAGDAGRAYDDLRAQLDRTPLPVGDRRLTQSQFDVGALNFLYAGRNAWGPLAGALAAAANGDGAPLLRSADQYFQRADDGTYSGLFDAYNAIACLDAPTITLDQYRNAERRTERAAPRTGATNASITALPCAAWPIRGRPAPVPHGSGAAPIVVFNATADPATPVRNAQRLVRDLESGILVTEEGEAHALIGGLSDCVKAVLVPYLVDLTPPASSTHC
jgi:pimeloyl-ACP methyl ester carboxylesterase